MGKSAMKKKSRTQTSTHTLFVMVFVCLYPIKVKMVVPIEHRFWIAPHREGGRFMDDQK